MYPHPEHFAAWGWLASNAGDGRFVINIMSGTVRYAFSDRMQLVQYLTQFFGHDHIMSDSVNLKKSINGIRVRVSENGYANLNVWSALTLPTATQSEMPPSVPSIFCTSGAPRYVDTAPVATSEQRAPKRPRTTVSKPPVSSPPRSPMRTDGGDSYDIMKIGGDQYEMKRVQDTCPTWSDETVIYVIDNGGRPPLLDISGSSNMDLFCAFRAPNGDVVRNVRVAKSIIAVVYGRE
tara:strand:+ start:4719 stop:5423 length:705 start_codon:yes stop_codon:yes gene_type:complete